MAARTYENFDLLLEAEPDGGYRTRVVSTPCGDVVEGTFSLPFDATRLENLLLKLEPGRPDLRRGSLDHRADVARELGQGLFESLFTGDVALAWARSRDAVRRPGKGLRLRLRLDDAPRLARLPWELLYDRRTNTFLAQSERTPVVRFLDVPHTLRPLDVGGALHILTVISAPTDLPELDVEAEWARVRAALADRIEAGTVVLERLPAPTLSALGTWLRRHTAHVLHFIGHGDFDPASEDGIVYFCDRYGRSQRVTASVLGPYVYDHDPLRLIVLNACRSASTDTEDPFAGIAQGLVQQHSTAVVAMQFPITDRAAMTFTEEFYGALADEYPVDQAVTYARKALRASFGTEWATPTVFMQSTDGKVFSHIVAEHPSPAAGTPPQDATEAGRGARVQPTLPTGPEPGAFPAPTVDSDPATAPAGLLDWRSLALAEPELPTGGEAVLGRGPAAVDDVDDGPPSWLDPTPLVFRTTSRPRRLPMLSLGGGLLVLLLAALWWLASGAGAAVPGAGSDGLRWEVTTATAGTFRSGAP